MSRKAPTADDIWGSAGRAAEGFKPRLAPDVVASATTMAVMLTTSLTEAPRWRTWTIWDSPLRMGPITSAALSGCSNLYEALTAVGFAKTRTFAARVKGPSGRVDSSRSGTVGLRLHYAVNRDFGAAPADKAQRLRTRAGSALPADPKSE